MKIVKGRLDYNPCNDEKLNRMFECRNIINRIIENIEVYNYVTNGLLCCIDGMLMCPPAWPISECQHKFEWARQRAEEMRVKYLLHAEEPSADNPYPLITGVRFGWLKAEFHNEGDYLKNYWLVSRVY